MKKIIIPAFLILFLLSTGCMKVNPKQKINNPEFAELLENYYQEGLILNPFEATQLGDNRYNNRFPDFLSDEYREQKKQYYTKYLKSLENFSDDDLNEEERTSRTVLKWECEINLESFKFKDDLIPIDQMWSLNLYVARLAGGTAAQPFKTVKDYYNWIERLDGYTKWLATAETRMREGIKSGYVLPKSLIVKIIPQLKSMISEKPDENLFYTPIMNMPETFSETDKQNLTEAYSDIIKNKIIPAYKSLYNFVTTEYFAAGRKSSGFYALPDGKENYQYRIKNFTTTTLTADSIHKIGLKEVNRIHSEMEKVKNEVGFEGSLKAFFAFVKNNPTLKPFTKPQQVIDNFNAIHERMKPQLVRLFDKTPKAGFEVRRTEAFREKSASAQYNSASKDGSRPGIFYVPIPDVKNYNTFQDESLFLHEAIPGHHYQISLTQENENLPDFRRNLWYSAYGEGWALYAESLGKELGLYTDPYQYFGMLNGELHRAIRLVVDTGIHTMGWSREQAIDYCLHNEASSTDEIIQEIERYMANPGQALSYKIGQLKILELRNKAEKELGKKFNIKEFHNQILQTGCVPLAILEEKINNWIGSYN